MISREPIVNVGIIEHAASIEGTFNGVFILNGTRLSGPFSISLRRDQLLFVCGNSSHSLTEPVLCSALEGATFTLNDVTIGINFHWERKEAQTFQGNLKVLVEDDLSLTIINEVLLELYLCSVISSEMSGNAPLEFLKAHAITSRSWLCAMLEREHRNIGIPSQRTIRKENEVIRWYDREDHDLYDVCADDHCQRYQGASKIISETAKEAVEQTRGIFLTYDGAVCDARFSKSCGGRTEEFQNAWEDSPIPYLSSIADSAASLPLLSDEGDAEEWILSSPDVYCNTTDGSILRQVLPSFDQETTDFFRWTVEYSRSQLEELIEKKSGEHIGRLEALLPLDRGPSGRIYRLKIAGSKKSIVVGKELEIRRWLSETHLNSSAFTVETVNGCEGEPEKFILHGGGWGHGVGLCQIGAAVMASKGFSAEDIVGHYFSGAKVEKLY